MDYKARLVKMLRDMSAQNPLGGLGDVARTFGQGMAADVPAGWAGLLELGRSGDAGMAADKVEEVRRRLGFIPEADSPGSEILQGIGETIGPPMEWLKENTADVIGKESPAAGAATLAMASVLPMGKVGRAAQVARKSKRVKSTGRMVGAPTGTGSHQKVQGEVAKYAGRVESALDEGARPGWFYGEGSDAINRVSDNAADASVLARGNAITSSEAPVATNFGWAQKGIEQDAMGVPLRTGRYPSEVGKTYGAVLRGEDPYLGHKRERYGRALAGDTSGKAPNDRWEIRSQGYSKDTVAPTQAAHMDDVRARAIDSVNKRRGLNLNQLEGQELNWAKYSADEMGIPVTERIKDTVQSAIPEHTFLHSWESMPGAGAKHMPEIKGAPPDAWREYHEAVKGAVLDPRNKDDLIRGMGGRYQEAAYDAPGYFKGEISPGTQSRSLVARTQAGGLDPSSRARVEGTELTRALFLGQDAAAGHIPLPAKTLKGTDTVVAKIGRPMSEADLGKMSAVLDAEFGAGNVAPIATPNGMNLLNVGVDQNFAKRFKAIESKLDEALGVRGSYAAATREKSSFYEELPWDKGGATKRVVEALKNPNAPRLAEHASSEATRGVAGRIAAVNERMAAKGMTPNPALQRLLKAWAEGGLPAAEDLVKRGLAPAVGLVTLQQLLAEEGGQAN